MLNHTRCMRWWVPALPESGRLVPEMVLIPCQGVVLVLLFTVALAVVFRSSSSSTTRTLFSTHTADFRAAEKDIFVALLKPGCVRVMC